MSAIVEQSLIESVGAKSPEKDSPATVAMDLSIAWENIRSQ